MPATSDPPASSSSLAQLRNLEEFAALGQFLFCFGTEVLGLPDFGREELETELFSKGSVLVPTICIALLKMVSSHRGLVPDQFEDYTRRQYRVRKPGANPFGEEQEPVRFGELDVLERVRVLHQLSLWAFQNPERIRDKMKDADEKEQLTWRMEPCGFDRGGNTYYILDDNRLYRRTPWILDADDTQPVKKVKGASRRKAPKRRRVEDEMAEEVVAELGAWSCVCVTLHDWTVFVNGLESSKDLDERALRGYLKEDVLPELTRGWMEKEKERQLQDAVANRKRSSRLDEKIARQRAEEEREAAVKRDVEMVKAARQDQMEVERQEKERELRVMVREQRHRERNLRKKKDGMSTATSENDSSTSGARRSSRRAKEVVAKTVEDEGDWVFDCVCGENGINYDDGTEIIACDSCDVWQHLKCQHLAPGGEKDDFICDMCSRYRQGEKGLGQSPQIIKLRVSPLSPVKSSAASVGVSRELETGVAGERAKP